MVVHLFVVAALTFVDKAHIHNAPQSQMLELINK